MKTFLKKAAFFVAVGMIFFAFCSFGAGAALSYAELTQNVFESNVKMMSYGSDYLDIDYLATPFTTADYAELNAKATEITSSCKTAYDKAYKINEWVADNVCYDYDYYYHGSERPSDYAPNVFETGIAVCEGYARLMDAMCRAAGVPSRIVFGTSFSPIQTIDELNTRYESEKITHAWVEVYVNGAWNLCDPTWDSANRYEYGKKQIGTSGDYYFTCDTKSFSERHYNIQYISFLKLGDFLFRVYKDEKKLNSYLGNGGKVVFPDVEITNTAAVFVSKGSKVTEVVLPKSQTVIPNSLCRYCSGLKSVEIPAGVEKIDFVSFSSCTSLETVSIPSTVKTISTNAFSNDNAIKTVYFGGTQSEWNKIEILSGNDALLNAKIVFTDHTHTYSSSITKKATCTEAGVQKNTCTVCGYSYESQTPLAAHKETTIPAVAATCSKTGLTEGKKCSVCGKITVAQKTTAKTAHTIVTLPAVAATCSKMGLTEGKKCSVCGKITVAQTMTAKAAHKETTIPAVAATCQKTGLTEGKKCSVCGTVTVAQTTTAKTAHTYSSSITKKATCTEAGVQKNTCTVCGYSYESQTSLAAHTIVTLPAVTATCQKAGLTEGKKCSVCGKITVAQKEIAKGEHILVTVPAVEATCQKTGLTEGKECIMCGMVTVAQKEIPITDHQYKTSVLREPTCTLKGVQRNECRFCKRSYNSSIPLAAHKETTIPAVAATCSKTGLTEGKKCSVCGTVTVTQKETAKTAHTYSSSITKKATCLEAGVQKNTCTVCGYSYESQTPLGAHTIVTVPAVAATCSKTGLTEGKKCSVCGKITVAQKTTAKTDHKFGLDSVKDPTCTEEGVVNYRCTVCSATWSEPIEKLDHIDFDHDNICDKCSTRLQGDSCGCMCHKGGFNGFIYRIVKIFWKIFKINKKCACGVVHY